MLLVLLGAAVPLAILPALLFHYDSSPKAILVAIAAALALLAPNFRADMTELLSRRSGRLFTGVAVLSIVWCGVVTATSARPWFSLYGSTWRQFGLVTIAALLTVALSVAGQLCAKPNSVRVLLRILACAGIAASCYGIAQYFDVDPFQAGAGYHALDGDAVIVRPPGPLGHADYFGWWLAIEFFCGVALAAIETSTWRRVAIASIALTGAATLLTGTRSAIAAILAGAIGWLILSRRRLHPRYAAGVCLIAAAIAGFVFSPAGARIRARISWSRNEPLGGARPILWRDSLSMAARRPVLGFGPETFPSEFLRYQSEDLAHVFPDFHQESPHNAALDALTAGGTPALLLLVAWAMIAFRSARESWRRAPSLAAPLAAALMAFVVGAMFNALVVAPVLLALLVIAMLVAQAPRDETVSAPIFSQSAHCPQSRWGKLLLAGPACLFLTYATLAIISDFNLARFGKHPGVTAYRAVTRTRLPGAAEDIYCSRMLANTCQALPTATSRECWGVAVEAAARATRTADDPANAWYNLAIFTAARNDLNGTSKALKTATYLAPNWFKPHWILAQLLSRQGDKVNAMGEAQRARSLDNNHDAEVTRTFFDLKETLR